MKMQPPAPHNLDAAPNARPQFYLLAQSYEGGPRSVKGILQTREPLVDLESAVAYAVHVLESVARVERAAAVNAPVSLLTEALPIQVNREGNFCVVGSVRVGGDHRLTLSVGRGIVAP